jgi:hypothetical protein
MRLHRPSALLSLVMSAAAITLGVFPGILLGFRSGSQEWISEQAGSPQLTNSARRGSPDPAAPPTAGLLCQPRAA